MFIYIITMTLLNSIFLSVSVFRYSCSSSGSSSLPSVPDAVFAVSAVWVSAIASWPPFVAVVLTFPHLVQHSPHLEQTERVGHVWTNIVLPGCWCFFMCLWESINTQYCLNYHISYGVWVLVLSIRLFWHVLHLNLCISSGGVSGPLQGSGSEKPGVP